MNKPLTPAQYDGWFTNLFTKEGRAENKENRAERLREKSKGKSADSKAKLQQRADENEIEAAELTRGEVAKEQLGPSNAASLWGVNFPWLRRPEGDLLAKKSVKVQDLAEGSRPSRGLINLEHRATIIAGLTILRKAYNPKENKPGYGPFRSIDVDQVPVLIDDANQDMKLIAAVAKAARARGEIQPKSLNDAAEQVRDLVEEENLGKPAWAMRAMLLYSLVPQLEKKQTDRKATAAGVYARLVAPFFGLPPKATQKVVEVGVKLGAKAAKRSEYKALSSIEQLYAQMYTDALVARRIKNELKDAQEEAEIAEQDLALARKVAVIGEQLEEEYDEAEEKRSSRRNLLIFGSVIAALSMVGIAQQYKKRWVTAP
jgi:hypothetical protein